jgi:WD40 repeat protein
VTLSAVDTCAQVYSPDGRQLLHLQAYKDALGVKSLAWSPSGAFLAVGSYDQVVRVVCSLTWTVVAEFRHVHPRWASLHPAG